MRPLLGRFAGINKLSNYRNRVEVHATKNIEGQPHILASFDRSGIAFPGGGIEHGGAVSSAKREMLEEAGYSIKKPKLVSKGQRYTMSQKWQDESLSKRGKQYKGVNNHIVHAELDSSDERLLNVEGDAMSGLKLIPVEQAHHMLRRQERMAEFSDKDDWSQRATASRVALERKYPHLRKMASKRKKAFHKQDQYVYHAAPTGNRDSIAQRGILSGAAILEDPEMLTMLAKKRNWSEAKVRAKIEKNLKDEYWRKKETSPSVFFSEPDWDQVPEWHTLRQDPYDLYKVNLSKYMREVPGAKIHGIELKPWVEGTPYEERDLTLEEATELASRGPKGLWKDYAPVKGYYAVNVPHAFLGSDANKIPAEYAELVGELTPGPLPKKKVTAITLKDATQKKASYLRKEAAAPRDYKREYRLFHSSPEAKRNRAKRNLWNRRLKGKVPAGYEIDHKRQLRDGGGNGRDNIRFLPISKNRAEHNRNRVVKDHMRKESSALKGAIIGGGLGGMIGGLDSPDGMRLGNAVKGAVIGGALGGGIGAMHRMMSPTTFNLSKEQMAKLPKNFSGDMFVREGDKIRHLYMNSSGKVTIKGYAPEMASKFGKSDLLINTTKTASFDPHQWVYDSLIKQAQAVAVKRDPAKWEAAKREAKAKMGGKHSARAMQLATQIYKKKGGTYSGKKPSPSNNKLKKWTKQDWQWSKEDHGVYLPKRSASALKSSKAGRSKLLNAERAKRQATAQGVQFSRHGLHTGKKRSDVS